MTRASASLLGYGRSGDLSQKGNSTCFRNEIFCADGCAPLPIQANSDLARSLPRYGSCMGYVWVWLMYGLCMGMGRVGVMGRGYVNRGRVGV